eukprot:CAMPEP_0201602730 /NCGR_PEP_ID=MMETSP0492-20130828/3374_1 /ASSEMBLY_ACC=CAM_ASM_000837 /TAXON_ID=420259 /ORGANISM="Thalassiosira gravida, Strain GMp14c1" /LENGTH=221 /DNA_ID=CAMNT_0048066325 /DNA_START=227 /DNA_END=892 /DNA_ORIENTATION=-
MLYLRRFVLSINVRECMLFKSQAAFSACQNNNNNNSQLSNRGFRLACRPIPLFSFFPPSSPKPYLLAILPNQLNVSNLISPSVATARRGKGGEVDDASSDVPEDDEGGSPSFVFPRNPCKACDAAPSMLILPPRDRTSNRLSGSSLRFLMVPRVYSMARESSGQLSLLASAALSLSSPLLHCESKAFHPHSPLYASVSIDMELRFLSSAVVTTTSSWPSRE